MLPRPGVKRDNSEEERDIWSWQTKAARSVLPRLFECYFVVKISYALMQSNPYLRTKDGRAETLAACTGKYRPVAQLFRMFIRALGQNYPSDIILAKRVTDRVGGAQRRVSIRCRAERAKTRARGCESRSGFVYIYIYIYKIR